jgi:hypothetical protein
MNNNSKKNRILQNVERLIELMEKTMEIDEFTNSNLLFPENYLDVLEIKDRIINKDKLPREDIIKLNYYFRETSMIKDSIEKTGKRIKYEEFVEWKIREILENTDEKNNLQRAIHFVKENIVKKDGNLFNIEEATEYVKSIKSNYKIKNNDII